METSLCNVADLISVTAKRTPDHTALIFEGLHLSYRQLHDAVDRFAAALRRSGLKPGSVVGIYLDSHPDLVIGYLGTLRAGYVSNIVNGSLKGREAHYILADSDTKVLLTDDPRHSGIQAAGPLPRLERTLISDASFRSFWEGHSGDDHDLFSSAASGNPQELSTLMYTSGTTGHPKGVMLSHSNILDNAIRFGSIHFNPEDVLTIGAPLFHCWGLINGLLGIFSVGGTAVIMRRFQTEVALEAVRQHKATQFLGVAAMYNFMCRAEGAKEAMASLRCVHSAAAPTPVELIERLQKDFGIDYAESYGLTETSPVITTAAHQETRPGSCGRAMGDTQLKVVSADGDTLGVGEIGELWAKGTAIMLGYWRRPEETAEAITSDGWFKTGDIVKMDEDGYVYIVDRKKDMINVAGEKVYPREVEEILFAHPGVADAAVVGIAHQDKGEVPKAYVVMKDGWALTEEEIIAFCKERLASYKVPYTIEFVEEVPRSASGKVLRRMLKTSTLPSYEHIRYQIDGAIAVIEMHRPSRRNALSMAHMTELLDAFRRTGENRSIGAIILRGAGPVFCSGHDLKEMQKPADPSFFEELFGLCTELMECIQQIPQPVIAQVGGMATAAGCQLVATCDLAVASDEATFATPGVKIGLFCSTPMVALTRSVGRKKALEMLLTGDPLTAQEALVHGLVNRVVAPERLEEETWALAQKVVGASRHTVGLGKEAFYRQIELDQAEAYRYAREVMVQNAASEDATEGICAFLEKRAPVWKGA